MFAKYKLIDGLNTGADSFFQECKADYLSQGTTFPYLEYSKLSYSKYSFTDIKSQVGLKPDDLKYNSGGIYSCDCPITVDSFMNESLLICSHFKDM